MQKKNSTSRRATLGILAISVLAVWLFPNINALDSGKPLAETLDSKPEAKELIVVVHGYRGDAKEMQPVREAIREVRPDADILQFEFPAQLFSNANLFSIASQMEESINSHYVARKYERIQICGYSVGALLARKAYVYGCASIADAPVVGSQAVDRTPNEWTTKVERFVLLAGMNRGWQRKQWIQSFGVLVAQLSGTGALIRQCEKGEPFVANLRLQWLSVMRGRTPNSRPLVIQLLGDSDDIVSSDDSKDVTVAREFIWSVVHNTNHGNITKVGKAGTALERKQKIQRAFGNKDEIAELKRMSPVSKLEEDPDVTSVVFVLHGIRDLGEWTSQFEKPLQDSFLKTHADGSKLHVHRASYPYFGMFPFLIWSDRQKNVRWFMDEVTELTAQYPNLKPEDIHFIGHSNGTYILASALEKYATLKVGRAALAGSVIRQDFPWKKYNGRISQVRNYVGSDDWVVGLLPHVFEQPFFSFLNKDIGSAGFNGFLEDGVKKMETKFVRGDHSAALVEANIPSIVAFIAEGKKIEIQELQVNGHPAWLEDLSKLCWVLWIVVLVLAALLVWLLPFVILHARNWCDGWFNSSPQGKAVEPKEKPSVLYLMGVRLVFVFLVWLFLNTY